MSAPDPTPRPRREATSNSELEAEELFDPGDDSDLGIDDAASEDVGLDVRSGLDDLSPEQWVDDSAAEDERWTDGNEPAGDAIGDDDGPDDPDTQDPSEYGWTEGNEPSEALDAEGDGLQDLPPSAGDDGGEEGIEDEGALVEAGFGKFEPLAEESPDGADADAEVMSEFAALAGAQALSDDEGVTIAEAVQWGRYRLGIVHVDEPVAAGGPDANCRPAGDSLWLDAGGPHVVQDGLLRRVSWDGLPDAPRAVALPSGASLLTEGASLSLVEGRGGQLFGSDGAGRFGPLPALPPLVDHGEGRPLFDTVGQPRGRRLAAWPGHGLYVSEPGAPWRPKVACAGVQLLASDGLKHVAVLTERGLQRSSDGGDGFGEPIDLRDAFPEVARTADGLWVCREFSILRSAEGLLAHGPHGFTRLLGVRPGAVAVTWERSLPVVYCHVACAAGGGVLARIEVRRTRTPARVVLETSEAGPGVALAARSLADGTLLQLWVAGQLWMVSLASGAEPAP